VDVSVLVEDSANGAVMLDATVDLRLEGEHGAHALNMEATRHQATNKLLESAIIDLPTPGQWELTVLVRYGLDQAVFKTQLQVATPLPRLASVWPFVALPPLVVLLFVGHQVLQWRRFRRLE
jgi:hypothetical protein